MQAQWQPHPTAWGLWRCRWNGPSELSWVGWPCQAFTTLHIQSLSLGSVGRGSLQPRQTLKGPTTEGPSVCSTPSNEAMSSSLKRELVGTSQHPHCVLSSWPSASVFHSVYSLPKPAFDPRFWPRPNNCLVLPDPYSWERGQNHGVLAPWVAWCSEWDGHFRPKCKYLLDFGHHSLLRNYSFVYQLGSSWTARSS